jgi:hypothetical protein
VAIPKSRLQFGDANKPEGTWRPLSSEELEQLLAQDEARDSSFSKAVCLNILFSVEAKLMPAVRAAD